MFYDNKNKLPYYGLYLYLDINTRAGMIIA